ncbi:MAG TPA: hypothetical protein VGE34_02720 [Candidatus Saccharimonadales bacterium]
MTVTKEPSTLQGEVIKEFGSRWATVQTTDGSRWESIPNPDRSDFKLTTETQTRTGLISSLVRGVRIVSTERVQVASAGQKRPFEHGQPVMLTMQEDMVTQKRSSLLWSEKSKTEKSITAIRGVFAAVATTAILGALIGGPGERMSDEARKQAAIEMIADHTRELTGAEQFEQNYLTESNKGDGIGAFDDSSNSNFPAQLFNSGVSRVFAEYDHANVAAGDDCLVDNAYNIKPGNGRNAGKGASYKETEDGSVTVTAASGDALTFDISSGVLTPVGDDTKTTLKSLKCKDGVSGAFTRLGYSGESFVIPFDEIK